MLLNFIVQLPSKVVKLHGSAEERAEQKRTLVQAGAFDVCLTTYEIAIREKAHLRKFHWGLLVVDEIRFLSNYQSRLPLSKQKVKKVKINKLQ